MINPIELRIGSYVEYNGEIIKLDGSLLCCYIQNELEFPLKPIPLTEEILLKFWFNKEYQKGYIGIDVCNSDFVLTEPLKMGEWQTNYTFQFETGSVHKFKEIEYVNQLQNLYFALTGEELMQVSEGKK